MDFGSASRLCLLFDRQSIPVHKGGGKANMVKPPAWFNKINNVSRHNNSGMRGHRIV
jgi:hypothetical protein